MGTGWCFAIGPPHLRCTGCGRDLDVSERTQLTRKDLCKRHRFDRVGLAAGGYAQGYFGCRSIEPAEDAIDAASRLVSVISA